jgi:hypothetical protein
MTAQIIAFGAFPFACNRATNGCKRLLNRLAIFLVFHFFFPGHFKPIIFTLSFSMLSDKQRLSEK